MCTRKVGIYVCHMQDRLSRTVHAGCPELYWDLLHVTTRDSIGICKKKCTTWDLMPPDRHTSSVCSTQDRLGSSHSYDEPSVGWGTGAVHLRMEQRQLRGCRRAPPPARVRPATRRLSPLPLPQPPPPPRMRSTGWGASAALRLPIRPSRPLLRAHSRSTSSAEPSTRTPVASASRSRSTCQGRRGRGSPSLARIPRVPGRGRRPRGARPPGGGRGAGAPGTCGRGRACQ